MFTWIYHNLATILVCAVLLLVVFLILRGMIRDRRAGKSLCGGAAPPALWAAPAAEAAAITAAEAQAENASVHENKGDGRSS